MPIIYKIRAKVLKKLQTTKYFLFLLYFCHDLAQKTKNTIFEIIIIMINRMYCIFSLPCFSLCFQNQFDILEIYSLFRIGSDK